MQKNLGKILLLLLTSLFLLSSCINIPGINLPGGEKGEILEDDGVKRFTPDEDKIAVFANGAPQGFWARNDRGNGPPFNCSFSSSNAIISGGTLSIVLNKQGEGFVGAEYRTRMRYSYGYF